MWTSTQLAPSSSLSTVAAGIKNGGVPWRMKVNQVEMVEEEEAEEDGDAYGGACCYWRRIMIMEMTTKKRKKLARQCPPLVLWKKVVVLVDAEREMIKATIVV
jgi:hypothetical protein